MSLRVGMRADLAKTFPWSEWRRPTIAVALTFLCNVQNGMVTMGDWPYMSTASALSNSFRYLFVAKCYEVFHQIDPDVTSVFYGYVTSTSKAAHAIFALVFAVWAHKIANIKIPLMVGCIITLISCVMYIFVEFLPYNRRWWMLVCYLLFGVGFGTSPLLRAYIARVTSEENRSTAYALQNGAIVLSILVGPIAQIAFFGLPYPGVDVIPPNIKLNIFTAPIWLSIATNIIAIALVAFALDDVRAEMVDVGEKKRECCYAFSLSSMKARISQLRELRASWALIALVIVEKMVSTLFNSTMFATLGPVMGSMYAFDGEQMVLIMAISQVAVGLIAVVLAMMFFLCKLGRRVSCRALFVFSNLITIAGYAITYPYPFMSNPMQPFNGQYNAINAVNIYPFVIVLVVTSSLAIPSAMMSLDTIYSKLVANIDQDIMQSLFVIAEDIISIVGPIYATTTFTAIGSNYVNIINGSIYILATILWITAWRWLLPFK